MSIECTKICQRCRYYHATSECCCERDECILVDKMDFSDALNWVKHGKKIARAGWNGKNMWVRLFEPCTISNGCKCSLSQPFLVIEYPKGHSAYPDGSCIPWLASQSDIMADDWVVVE